MDDRTNDINWAIDKINGLLSGVALAVDFGSVAVAIDSSLDFGTVT